MKRMIRKNVMLDDESFKRLKDQSGELKMNHSEYIRHLLAARSKQESDVVLHPHIVVGGRHFKWDGKDSYILEAWQRGD